jgi:hypothetical protein
MKEVLLDFLRWTGAGALVALTLVALACYGLPARTAVMLQRRDR